MENKKVKSKVALITGASSGIGKATALKFAQVGLQVALVARRTEKLEVLRSIIQDMGGEADYYTADVGSEDDARSVVQWALDMFGTVDVLVNNAGILRPGTIEAQNPQEWRDTFDVNLLAPMYLSQALLPTMKKRRTGHIVNISSNAAKVPLGANLSSYSASKYGITAFSAALRREVAAHGIRVTIVEPGTTETEVADSIPEEASRNFIDSCVRGVNVMLPEDVAEAILYAISQPARVNVDEIWLTPTVQ